MILIIRRRNMNIWERRAIARKWQERRIRRRIGRVVEEVCCFFGTLAWLSFLGYTFAKAVFER